MALRLQQVMIAARARTGKVLIHFPEVSLGKIYIAHWSAMKGDPAARAERVTRHTGHIPLLPLHANSYTTQQLGEKSPHFLSSFPVISTSWRFSLSICLTKQFVRQHSISQIDLH